MGIGLAALEAGGAGVPRERGTGGAGPGAAIAPRSGAQPLGLGFVRSRGAAAPQRRAARGGFPGWFWTPRAEVMQQNGSRAGAARCAGAGAASAPLASLAMGKRIIRFLGKTRAPASSSKPTYGARCAS